MSVTKAIGKGILENTGTGEKLVFQYNPGSYKKDTDVGYVAMDSPWASQPQYQYSGGGERKTTFQLFVDGREEPGAIEKFEEQLNKMFPNRFVKFGPPPPQVRFMFGDSYACRGMIASVACEYSMFNKNLRPLRATFDITVNVISSWPRGVI
jgi:hypothetical protein